MLKVEIFTSTHIFYNPVFKQVKKKKILKYKHKTKNKIRLKQYTTLKKMNFSRFFVAGVLFLCQSSRIFGCVTIATEQYTVTAESQWEVYKGAISAGLDSNDGIFSYTAPKQVRSWLGVMASAYTTMAWSQRAALDFFGRKTESDNSRRCAANTPAEQETLDNHAKESFTYAYLWSIIIFVPEWKTAIETYATSIGADLTKCSSSTENGCGIDNAIGLARKVVDDTVRAFRNDGWNADGTLTRTHNLVPFEDWRPSSFQPSFPELCVREWKIRNEFCSLSLEFGEDICWTEQLHQMENKDYFYREKYHIPHLADSARSYSLGNDYICDDIDIPNPCYDVKAEAGRVISRLASLDDNKKSKIEFFDNQFLWFNLFITQSFDNLFSPTQWGIIKNITAITATMYESTIVTWKVKQDYGIIRPKSYINKEFKGVTLESYRGQEMKTTGTILGEDWAPYLKDKPTAEYPSHIACLCSAFSHGMITLNGENIKADGSPLSINRPAGSSIIESDKPDTDQIIHFTTWNSIEDMCHSSQLNSGNHFSKSVASATTLCSNVASSVLEKFNKLTTGAVPESNIDFENLPLQLQRCQSVGHDLLEKIGLTTPSTPISAKDLDSINGGKGFLFFDRNKTRLRRGDV